MPTSSLLALLDDIAGALDDVAAMTKLAAGKTAGVLGDDLALNAEQVTGVPAVRELPVVWAVALGSLRNKAILVPAALLLSALLPGAVAPLLMLGGAFLCYEGFEKIAHRLLHGAAEAQAAHAAHAQALQDPAVDMVAFERDKVRGAVRTDFVLSAEIIVITLGAIAGASFGKRVAVLAVVALLMTVGVYGLVAAIVKLDDAGARLGRVAGRGPGARALRGVGAAVLRAAPLLMKGLSIVGTAAMFLVGGGILAHGFAPLHHAIEGAAEAAGRAPAGALLHAGVPPVLQGLVGVSAGAVLVAGAALFQRLRRLRRRNAPA